MREGRHTQDRKPHPPVRYEWQPPDHVIPAPDNDVLALLAGGRQPSHQGSWNNKRVRTPKAMATAFAVSRPSLFR